MIEGTFRKDKSAFVWTLVVTVAVIVGGALAVVVLIRGDITVAMIVAGISILLAALAIRQVRRRLVLVRFDGQRLTIHDNGQVIAAEAPYNYGIRQIATAGRAPTVYTLRIVVNDIALEERIPTGVRTPTLPTLNMNATVTYTSTTPFPGTLWRIIHTFDLPTNPLVAVLMDTNDSIRETVAGYNYSEAIRLLTRQTQHEANATVYFNRGLLKDDKNAIGDFSSAIKLDPRFFEAYQERALAHSRLKRWREVLADCESALNLRQDDTLYNLRGVAHFALGNFGSAITSYDHAIAHNPQNAQAYNNRGVVRQRIGDPDSARADYELALQLDPDLTTAQDGLASLRD